MKISGVGSAPVTINVSQSAISFTANGTPYAITVPNATINVTPGSTTAKLSSTGSWNETVPYPFSGNVLLDAVQFPVTTSLPGGIQDVTWSNHFTSTATGVGIQWAWGAAVYNQFNTDYNALGVKPVDADNTSQYSNSDHAGTPENYKSQVTGGATGGGGSNYTGGLSGTAKVTPCTISTQPFYVTDINSNSVLMFGANANGNVAPNATLGGNNTSIFEPLGVALDSANNIYVVNHVTPGQCCSGGYVTKYAAGASGNVAPIATIGGPDTGLNTPWNVGINSSGSIYVTNPYNNANTGYPYNNSVTVFAAGSSGDATPSANLPGVPSGVNTQLWAPFDIAFDANGNFYVVNGGDSLVTEYAAGSNGDVASEATISIATSGQDQLEGLALDGKGNIYVANTNTNSILIYAPGSSGSAPPNATISGTSTGLNGPVGIEVDSAGQLYVVNSATPSVTVYGAGATGNASPIATIAGSNTTLGGPEYITLLH